MQTRTMDPVDALTRLGGVAKLRDLLRLTTRSRIRAAEELGWEIARQPSLPQVVLPRHRSVPDRTQAEVRRHPVTSTDVRGLVTGPAMTVLLCARDLPFDEALTVADSCLRHQDLDHDALVRVARARDPGRRSGHPAVRGTSPRVDPAPRPRRSASRHRAGGGLVGLPRLEVRPRARLRAVQRTDRHRLAGAPFGYDHVMSSPSYVVTTIQHLLAELAA